MGSAGPAAAIGQNPYRRIERGSPGAIGWRVHYFNETSSTQDRAAELAKEGAAEGTVVIAESQSAGRGRLGRRWYSPSGVNLYATILLRPPMAMNEVACLSLVAGVAVAEALESKAGQGLVSLKWPNDVWLRGKKAGGIIAQALWQTEPELFCVLLGVGLNINLREQDIPAELRGQATSLLIQTGSQHDRTALAAVLFSKLNTRYTQFRTSGFAAVRPLWERYSALTGKRVTVADGVTRYQGLVNGIDADGALLLDTGTSVTRIMVGDVTIERASG